MDYSATRGPKNPDARSIDQVETTRESHFREKERILPVDRHELDVPFTSAIEAMSDVLRLDDEIQTIRDIASMNNVE